MKPAKYLLCCAIAAGSLFSATAFAASWQESLSSAASQLSSQSGNASSTQQNGLSLSSLTGLLNGGSKSLSADNMNNAAGIMQYCAKQKLASVTSTENVKNQVLDKLGLGASEQKQDTNYLDGLQGLLNSQNGEQLNLNSLGNSELAEKVKTKACDLVLKQGMNYIS